MDVKYPNKFIFLYIYNYKMNQVLFVIIVLAILYMFRDKWLKYMPDIVKKNVLVSGLVFGFAFCWFMGNNIEGFDLATDDDRQNFYDKCCGDGGVYNGSIVGCEATNPSGDELIPGGQAAAEGMCIAMFQNKEREQGGEAGYQAGRVARIEAAKQGLRDVCCQGANMGCFQRIAEDGNMPELGLKDMRTNDFNDVLRQIDCPNMD
jgi:hypothetical protein